MNPHRVATDVAILPICSGFAGRPGRRVRLALISALGWLLLGVAAVAAQATRSDALRVQIEVAAGTHYVGQGFELGVGVVGAGRRPEVDPPAIVGADVWLIRNNELKPISVSGIGSIVGQSNVFVSRYRVVPRRAGTLEIPSIRARLDDETGRSRPMRVTVLPVPPEGRPAEFLGGVGRFTLQAEASPHSVRVGQELDYRITVAGPAAWGMTGRPELKRFDRPDVGLRIEPRPVESIHEPPSRTFAYTLRPTRPGDAVLPPVAIAAFDPVVAALHHARHAERADPRGRGPGLRRRHDPGPRRHPTSRDADRTALRRGAILGAAALLAGLGRRDRLGPSQGPARRPARAGRPRRGASPPGRPAASATTRQGRPRSSRLRVTAALIRYLRLGIGRPPGALTPDEAREGVARCSESEELGAQAARIAARCDGLLYRDAPAPPEDPDRLREDARDLFARLGSRRS